MLASFALAAIVSTSSPAVAGGLSPTGSPSSALVVVHPPASRSLPVQATTSVPSPHPTRAPARTAVSSSPRPGHSPSPPHHLGQPRIPGRPVKHQRPVVPRHHRTVKIPAELSPREIVKLFCSLDAEGARLSDTGLRQEISRLTAWDEEPGWDEATVIRSFAVGDAESFGNFAHIEVRFSVLGTLTPHRLEPMPPIQTVEFHLERKGKVWHIESPLYEPHVFRSELLHQLAKGGAAPTLLKTLAAAR